MLIQGLSSINFFPSDEDQFENIFILIKVH